MWQQCMCCAGKVSKSVIERILDAIKNIAHASPRIYNVPFFDDVHSQVSHKKFESQTMAAF